LGIGACPSHAPIPPCTHTCIHMNTPVHPMLPYPHALVLYIVALLSQNTSQILVALLRLYLLKILGHGLSSTNLSIPRSHTPMHWFCTKSPHADRKQPVTDNESSAYMHVAIFPAGVRGYKSPYPMDVVVANAR
jgi:hypothetical protein